MYVHQGSFQRNLPLVHPEHQVHQASPVPQTQSTSQVAHLHPRYHSGEFCSDTASWGFWWCSSRGSWGWKLAGRPLAGRQWFAKTMADRAHLDLVGSTDYRSHCYWWQVFWSDRTRWGPNRRPQGHHLVAVDFDKRSALLSFHTRQASRLAGSPASWIGRSYQPLAQMPCL